MSKLDVLFVHPNAAKQIFQSLSGNLKAIEPPIWAALLANATRKMGYAVDILDSEALNLSIIETANEINLRSPKLAVIVVYGLQPSASTQNMYACSLLTDELKANYPDLKIALIGGHVSSLPEQTLNEEKADFVIQGEGIYTLKGLLASDLNDISALKKVPGLWFKRDSQTVFTGVSRVVAQKCLADELPGMAWDLLPMDKYRAHNWHCFDSINERQPYASIYTSLGCPFKCSFCCINAPFGKPSFRYWQPEFMIKQFDLLAEQYHVKNIKIADEMFVLKEKHFLKLCELLIERNHGFNIWAYARVDTVKQEHLEILKKAGINWLVLGIESKSKHVRNGVEKGRFDENDIFKVVKQIQNTGINVLGNYMVGLPDDTQETMQQTLDMAIELKCEFSNIYSAMAYPGSQLYDLALEKGWKLPDRWLGYSQHAYETLPLPTQYVSAAEVLEFRDKAWNKIFTNKAYLEFIKNKFGQETFQHITHMTKHKLERKNVPSRLNNY